MKKNVKSCIVKLKKVLYDIVYISSGLYVLKKFAEKILKMFAN